MQSPRQKMPFGMLGWLIAITVWLTWAPFALRVSGPPELQLKPSLDMETLSHLFLLMPIAVVLTAWTHDSYHRRSRKVLWGAITCFGLILELGQWWIEGRGLSLYDVLANCLGAVFAIWSTDYMMRRGIGANAMIIAVIVPVFAGLLGITIYGASQLSRASKNFRVSAWQPHFLVLAGDEFGGGRAYQGHIWHVRVCAGTSPQQVCLTPGARLEDRLRFVERAEASQYVEVSANVRSSSDMQRGPARIVTFSRGSALRNVTLAQRANDLIFRVRTPWTGPNGSHPEFVLYDAVPTGAATRVAATFDHGSITIKAESEAGAVSAAFHSVFDWGSLQLHRAGRVPVMWRGRAARIGTVLLPVSLGFAVGWLAWPRWGVAVLMSSVFVVLCTWLIKNSIFFSMLPPGAAAYLLTTGSAMLGVGSAAWGWRWFQPQSMDKRNRYQVKRDCSITFIV